MSVVNFDLLPYRPRYTRMAERPGALLKDTRRAILGHVHNTVNR